MESFDSLISFFAFLNENINYVVLRNFEYLPDNFRSEEHGDIDILTDDLEKLVLITGAKKVFNKSFRVQYEITINNENVLFDFRYVGDQYYCLPWEKNILKTKVLYKNCFFVMDDENLKYSLLYHALVNKYKIAEDYKKKINILFSYTANYKKELIIFLKKNEYSFVQPKDLSVVVNEKNVDFTPTFLCRVLYSRNSFFRGFRFVVKILHIEFLK